MKIAIIGSGISGLTCGHLLSPHHDIHLFEADSRLGGHTNTIDVSVASGQYSVDTGFIVFNDKNYPLFTKLMTSLEVPSKPSHMSFSVKSEKTGLEYNGTSLNSLFCQRMNLLKPSFYRMVKDILRFNKEATEYYLKDLKNQSHDLKTLEDYLHEHNYSEEFIENYIIPMGAALWSASREEMRRFPLKFFVRFFHHHGMLSVDDRPQWKVITGGSNSYIPKITHSFKHKIHLSTPVTSVNRDENGVEIVIKKGQEHLAVHFDQVIFACHADQTLKMLTTPTYKEKEILSAFAYRPNDVLLHTDTSILPKSKLGVASWNYYLPKVERASVAVTYNMNILQGIKSPETFLVSLNMNHLIDPKKIIKAIPYSHPIFDLNASNAQNRWEEISGKDRLHFCGAYWGNGFHEDGVRSAVSVSGMLGGRL